MTCSVEGCGRAKHGKSPFCSMHYKRFKRTGSTSRARREMGTGTVTGNGYCSVEHNGRARYEHIILAEKALGRPLPDGAEVHHLNGDKLDNHTLLNLVICPNRAYHVLLHECAAALGLGVGWAKVPIVFDESIYRRFAEIQQVKK